MMWRYDAVFVYRNGHYFIKKSLKFSIRETTIHNLQITYHEKVE